MVEPFSVAKQEKQTKAHDEEIKKKYEEVFGYTRSLTDNKLARRVRTLKRQPRQVNIERRNARSPLLPYLSYPGFPPTGEQVLQLAGLGRILHALVEIDHLLGQDGREEKYRDGHQQHHKQG